MDRHVKQSRDRKNGREADRPGDDETKRQENVETHGGRKQNAF